MCIPSRIQSLLWYYFGDSRLSSRSKGQYRGQKCKNMIKKKLGSSVIPDSLFYAVLTE